MSLQTLGYIGLRTKNLEDWTAYASRFLGMQLVDKSRGTASFRMDDKKQRLVVHEDAGDAPGYAPKVQERWAIFPETYAPKPETRVAVIGDSDFAAIGTLGVPGNRDLFMNIVGWLSQQDNLISIRPKEADDRRITLTATQESNIFWLSLLIVPGFVFGAGVFSWWRRRA